MLSSRSLDAFGDGASATKGGSLFNGPTTRIKSAACLRAIWKLSIEYKNGKQYQVRVDRQEELVNTLTLSAYS